MCSVERAFRIPNTLAWALARLDPSLGHPDRCPKPAKARARGADRTQGVRRVALPSEAARPHPDGSRQAIIATVHRRGYRFVANARERSSSAPPPRATDVKLESVGSHAESTASHVYSGELERSSDVSRRAHHLLLCTGDRIGVLARDRAPRARRHRTVVSDERSLGCQGSQPVRQTSKGGASDD